MSEHFAGVTGEAVVLELRLAKLASRSLALGIDLAVQLSVFPAFARFSPRLAPGFRHLPAFIWHRPGASLRGVFSEAYVAHPLSEDAVEGVAAFAEKRQPVWQGR